MNNGLVKKKEFCDTIMLLFRWCSFNLMQVCMCMLQRPCEGRSYVTQLSHSFHVSVMFILFSASWLNVYAPTALCVTNGFCCTILSLFQWCSFDLMQVGCMCNMFRRPCKGKQVLWHKFVTLSVMFICSSVKFGCACTDGLVKGNEFCGTIMSLF